ncbi:hypothetical protein AAG570_007617 [Ranatra chinensis]|uniref:Homeobox domain-containing protein n=1 Tax=Ranatra chinensis TaxID=642074 RepID=A0ABD0Y9B1_9HEMI
MASKRRNTFHENKKQETTEIGSKRKEGVQKRKLGRNPRIPFSASQVAALEERYRQSPYLSTDDVAHLSNLLRLSDTRGGYPGIGVSFEFGVKGFEFFAKDSSDCVDIEVGMKSVV